MAPYACRHAEALGRIYFEKDEEGEHRPRYLIDAHRVQYSQAFDRLSGKTQVVTRPTSPYVKTRATHSFEVSALAESIAMGMRLNQGLARAIGMAHDLGHPPFGHQGGERLNELAAAVGGFEHNLQSYRVVTQLERKTPEFPGLNLNIETIRGLLKYIDPDHPLPGVPEVVARAYTLEADVANRADEIAYLSSDLEDAIRLGYITLDEAVEAVPDLLGGLALGLPRHTDARLYKITSGVIKRLVVDLCQATEERLVQQGILSLVDVRRHFAPRTPSVVHFSNAVREQVQRLRAFLMGRFYKVANEEVEGIDVIDRVYSHLMDSALGEEPGRVIDMIAGMTDDGIVAFAREKGI